MATIKQKVAVDKLVENRGNVGKAMIEAGYTKAAAKNPKNLTESKGYKELCEKLGLTPNLIVKSLVADIKGKPKKRAAELRLGADIVGMTKQGNNIIVPVQINFGGNDEYA